MWGRCRNSEAKNERIVKKKMGKGKGKGGDRDLERESNRKSRREGEELNMITVWARCL